MMGVLPLQFMPGENAESMNLAGVESYSILGLEEPLSPLQHVKVEVVKPDGSQCFFQAILRLDTHREIELYLKKGIFQSILHKWKERIEI
jgi:aconitate hydratase